MDTYFDSGVLIKLYRLEEGSDRVASFAKRTKVIPFPFLVEMEVRNALRVLAGRGFLQRCELADAMALMDQDLRAGRLRRIQPDPQEIAGMAERLSSAHSESTLCRTLDLLHVAHAKVLGSAMLFSGDRRQIELARCAGLEVKTLER